VFASDPLVATLYRFFALEALLGDSSDGLKNGPLALRQMTLSAIATGGFRNPDDTFLAYKEVRSFAVHGEAEPPVPPEQASDFERVVRELSISTSPSRRSAASPSAGSCCSCWMTMRTGRTDRLDPRTRQRRVGQVPRQHHGESWAAAEAAGNDEQEDPLASAWRALCSPVNTRTVRRAHVSSSVSQAGSSASARYSNSPIGCSGVTASAAGYSPAREIFS